MECKAGRTYIKSAGSMDGRLISGHYLITASPEGEKPTCEPNLFNPGYMSLAGASTSMSISNNFLAIRPEER
ncbi:hypothetical protein CHS0354_021121, partial [Potamilus streckersoni]